MGIHYRSNRAQPGGADLPVPTTGTEWLQAPMAVLTKLKTDDPGTYERLREEAYGLVEQHGRGRRTVL